MMATGERRMANRAWEGRAARAAIDAGQGIAGTKPAVRPGAFPTRRFLFAIRHWPFAIGTHP